MFIGKITDNGATQGQNHNAAPAKHYFIIIFYNEPY